MSKDFALRYAASLMLVASLMTGCSKSPGNQTAQSTPIAPAPTNPMPQPVAAQPVPPTPAPAPTPTQAPQLTVSELREGLETFVTKSMKDDLDFQNAYIKELTIRVPVPDDSTNWGSDAVGVDYYGIVTTEHPHVTLFFRHLKDTPADAWSDVKAFESKQ